MDRVAIFNRNPTAGHATWHSSSVTRADYIRYCGQGADVGMDVLSRRLIQRVLNENHLPNLDSILVFGSPGYEAIVNGGTTPLDGNWFRDRTSGANETRSRRLLRHQRGTSLPHMLQIQIGWCHQAAVDSFLASAVRIVASIFGIEDTENM